MPALFLYPCIPDLCGIGQAPLGRGIRVLVILIVGDDLRVAPTCVPAFLYPYIPDVYLHTCILAYLDLYSCILDFHISLCKIAFLTIQPIY